MSGQPIRPGEEDERRALRWLMDVRVHGGPLERRYAATTINTLAWFEAHAGDGCVLNGGHKGACIEASSPRGNPFSLTADPARCPRCEGFEGCYHTFSGECELLPPAGRPVGQLRQPGDVGINERDDAAVAQADGDLIAVGRLDDLAEDLPEAVIVEGDPLAGAMLHIPKSTVEGWPLTGLCGICGQTVGCECAAGVSGAD